MEHRKNSFRISICIVACHITGSAFAMGPPVFLLETSHFVNEVVQEVREQKKQVSEETVRLHREPSTPSNQKRLEQLGETSKVLVEVQDSIDGKPITSLEAMSRTAETIRAISKPPLAICNGSAWYTENPNALKWKTYLTPVEANLARIARSVGMFIQYTDVPDGKLHWTGKSGGTAFVVGKSHILTNRHVLASYAFENASGWHLINHQVLHIAFPLEYDKCNPRQKTHEVAVTGIEYVGKGEQNDFAILKIENSDNLLLPVPLSDDHYNLGVGANVAAIGYPERPESCNGVPPSPGRPCSFLTEPQIDLLFQTPDNATPFPAQRISPGNILFNPLPINNQFSYDSSTWNGSSGSPVVSLVDGKVIGLHFQGLGGSVENYGYNDAIQIATIMAVIKEIAKD